MTAPLGVLGGPTRAVLDYGTGRLGDVSFSSDGSAAPTNWSWDGGTSTWIYTDGAALLEYRRVTVAPGVGLRLAGCPLAVSDTLTLGSGAYLSASGHASPGATGGSTVTRVSSAWLGGGSAGASGTTAPANGAASAAIASGALGGKGGTGGTVTASPTSRTGGAGGAITAWTPAVGPVHQSLCWHPFQGRSSVAPSGGSGGGSGGSGGTGTSPGGGGGGGVLVVMARRIVYSEHAGFMSPRYYGQHLRADGGLGSSTPSGSSSASRSGGGGGGGGGIVLLADTLAPTDGVSQLVATTYGGNGGVGWSGDSTTTSVSGGSGGDGGQIWIAYCQGPAPDTSVIGGSGGGGGDGPAGGDTGADGADGIAYVLSMVGR